MPAAHYGLGQIAMSRRDYAEAWDHFEKTLAQVPGANRVHYSLAMAYRGLGDAEKVKLIWRSRELLACEYLIRSSMVCRI